MCFVNAVLKLLGVIPCSYISAEILNSSFMRSIVF